MFKKKLKTRMRKHLALPLAMLLFLTTATTSWNDAVKAVDMEGTEYVVGEELQDELGEWATPTDVEEDISEDVSETEILADAPEDGSAVKIVRNAYVADVEDIMVIH